MPGTRVQLKLGCVLAGALILTLGGQNAVPSDDTVEGFQPGAYSDASGRVLRYRLFEPKTGGDGRGYPLIVYLHGIEAVGRDNRKQLTGRNQLGSRLWTEEAIQSLHPSFVLAPQCPFGGWWAGPISRKPSSHLRRVAELIDELSTRLPIDQRRIYVTGQSMGGFGAWALVAAFPDRFAAVVPVCGGGRVRTAAALAAVPIWAFHGGLDPLVPPRESRRMIAAIQKAGGKPRYTEFPHTMHDAWKLAYSDPALVTWLFAQRRALEPAASPAGGGLQKGADRR